MNTAPRPVLCATEPGLLSMRNSNVPTWMAATPAQIDEFFAWLFGSHEANNFDTVGIDSSSQMAETFLDDALSRLKHGKAAYGEMARSTRKHLEGLYFLPNKHVYLIAKQNVELGKKRPLFPGQDLNAWVPHRYDAVLYCDTFDSPQGQFKAFRARGTFDTLARDRSGNLNEFEPCDLTALFTKAMR
jgi:hypothetical protein